MDLQEYISYQYDNDPYWFTHEVEQVHNQQKVNEIIDIKEYLGNNKHAITQRPNETFNNREYEVRKIILNYAKTIMNFSVYYLLKNPVSLSGKEDVVNEFKRVYKRGRYDKVDKEILNKLVRYGECFEYPYLDKQKNIRSKIIDPSEGFAIYNNENEMIGFIQSYTVDYITYYNVFYPDVVRQYSNKGGETLRLVGEFTNLSGLPIHYKTENEIDENRGYAELNDYIDILDNLEDLISKAVDGYYKFIMGTPVIIGQRLKGDALPKHGNGFGIVLDDGGEFKYVSNPFEHQAFKELYGTLRNALMDIASVPNVITNAGQNISNIAEVAVSMMFKLSDIKASVNATYLENGFHERFKAIRTLLEYKDVTFNDDDFDSLSVVFSPATPRSTKDVVDNLEKLKGMDAISVESIIELVPYVKDKVQELDRIRKEDSGNNMGNNSEGNS